MAVKIEFGLPNGAGGAAAAGAAHQLYPQLKAWSKRHRVDLCYRSTRHDHRHWIEVEFLRERDYTLFALSWQGKSFMQWQRVQEGRESPK